MPSEAVAEPPVTEPPVDELTPQELEQKLRIQLVDVSHGVGANAIDAADEYINEQTRSGGIKGIAKRIWYGNLARDYIRHKRIQENREEIVESGNLYALSEASQVEHNQATQAIVERFTSEYDLLHQSETNKALEDTDRGKGFMNQIKQLVSSYASGEIEMDALVEERTRILNEYGSGIRREDRNKGLLYADNIIEVAQNARLAAEHGLALYRIDASIKGNIGEAKVGVRTEARTEKVDKIVDKLYQSRIGSLVNETTLIGATSLAMNLAKVSTKKATTALGATVGLGVGAGLIAGAREHFHIGQERKLHMRQMAEGGQMAENSKRRQSLENTRYQTASAQELIDSLVSCMEGVNLVGETDPLRLSNLLANISTTQSRIDMSDDQNLDLITYSSKMSVESERLALDIKLAEAKVTLQKLLDTTPGEQLINLNIGSTSADELIAERIEVINNIRNEDISQKDRVFRKLRAKRTLGMAALGAATGISVGLGVQEGKSLIDGGLNGIFTDPNSPNRDTLLAGIFGNGDGIGNGDQGPLHLDRFSETHLHSGGLQLPEGYKLDEGGHSIIGPDGKHAVDGLEWSDNGQLSGASMDALTGKGFGVHDNTLDYTHHRTVSEKVHHSPHEFFKHGHEGFVRDHRELWYDNNTPAPIFDQNELRMDWGANGTGIDEHGNYVFNVSRMTEDGSFHNGLSGDAKELAHDGKLAVALSMTKDSQQFVKIIHINEHGNAIIDKDSIAGQSMFAHEGGHAKFIGAYAETAQILSDSKEHGVHTRMLATVVGENRPHNFTEVVHHTVSEPREYHITEITPPQGDVPVEIPPVIPVYARRGLEAMKEEAKLTNPNIIGSYYGGRSLAELQEWVQANPGALRSRHEIKAGDGSRKWIEADGSEVVRDIQRERDTIRSYIDKEKSQNSAHWAIVEKVVNSMAPMENACRVTVNVPAWMEEKNLMNFLGQYTQQVDKAGNPIDPNLYEINVMVNRKTGSQPDQSVPVIEKFIEDYQNEHGIKPKVNYYDVELDPPYNNVGYARKLLTDAVVLRSLNRINQQKALYIETEDADLVNIDKKTINNLIEKLDANPHLDAVRGVQDRTPEYLKDNDMLFLRRRAWDFFEIFARAKKLRDPTSPNWNYTWNRITTGGWNTGYTAEAYALIGGYDSMEMGEDMILGEKMTMARGDGNLPNLEVVGQVMTRTDASPRRFIGEIITGNGAYSSDFSDEKLNQEIRDNTIPQLMKRIAKFRKIEPNNQAEFADVVKNYAQFAKQVTPTYLDATQLTKRMLFWLGFKNDDYEITRDNEVNIKNWDNVKGALDRYRRRYEAKLAASS